MGKGNRRKSAAADQLDSSDADSVSSTSTGFSELTIEHVNSLEDELKDSIDALDEKRGSTRETALSGIVNAFEGQVLLEFAENWYVTLSDRYFHSIKRGSIKEACLASRALGLLAVTVGGGSSAHQIMKEAIPKLSEVLKSGSDASKTSSVLDCLAVITFAGADAPDEFETTLGTMWKVIHPNSGSNVGPLKKPVPGVLAAAVSAWAFLLTRIGTWRINPNKWKESISHLSTLLEADNRSVRIAAGEAVAVLFELGVLDTSSDDETDVERFNDEVPGQKIVPYMLSLKAKILARVYDLSMEAGGKGTDKKNLSDQRELFQKIWDFVQTGECPEASLKISGKQSMLRTSTWTEMIQLNFLKRYLGGGFLKHAQDNEMLHHVFDIETDKLAMLRGKGKRILKAEAEKGWTQKLNKDRKMAQARKQGYLVDQDM